MIIFENKYTRIEYDESVPCVCWIPNDFFAGNDFQESFVRGMDFFVQKIKEQPNLGWLNVTNKLVSVKIEDLRWLDKNVTERGYIAGATKVAFITPEDMFGKIAVKMYSSFAKERFHKKIDVRTFDRVFDAKLWLRKNS